MNGFYEKYRDDDGELLVIQNRNSIYPAHFHLNMEICMIKSGYHNIKINGKEYLLTEGCIAVIDSYDIHSYAESAIDDGACAIVIPYSYLQRFNAMRNAKKIINPVISDNNLCRKLLFIVDEYLSPIQNTQVKRAGVELFLALLGDKLEYSSNPPADERELIRKILTFAQENYRQDASRCAIAKALGYTQEHISRVFHRYMKMGIAEYVNQLRIKHIENLRQSGDKRTTTELIYDAGFKSQQTYYRVKKNLS